MLDTNSAYPFNKCTHNVTTLQFVTGFRLTLTSFFAIPHL